MAMEREWIAQSMELERGQNPCSNQVCLEFNNQYGLMMSLKNEQKWWLLCVCVCVYVCVCVCVL